jgi:CBS domain-containing protein
MAKSISSGPTATSGAASKEKHMKTMELMTKEVRTCGPRDTLDVAAGAMWEGDLGCIPVVDAARRVVGMVTDRDLCMAAYTQGKALHAIPVNSAMAREAVCCRTDDDLSAALVLMQRHRLRRLPVVDAGGRLAGILSLNDLARQAARERTQKTRAVAMDEIASTLASICEPRKSATSEKRGATLMAAGRSDPEC